jgi:hypothetical protein
VLYGGIMATTCDRCGFDYSVDGPKDGQSGAAGYAVVREHGKMDQRICYGCAAESTKQQMIETGRATLYVTGDSPLRYLAQRSRGRRSPVFPGDDIQVSEWAGRLKFRPHEYSTGSHNIGGARLDVWFDGPDGHVWHGWHTGDSQILRCRRTKQLVKAYCGQEAS